MLRLSRHDALHHSLTLTAQHSNSPDGKLLALCRYDGKVYKALVWETANWTLLHDHEITNCIAQPAVADDELVLLKFNPGAYCDLAVVDLEMLQPRHPPHSVHGAYRPVLSNDGLRVGLHFRILDLESGTSQELNGPVYCLARDGQLYATRRCDMKGHRMERSPDWRLGLPIVRHWWRTRHYSAQVVLIDIATQIELTSSPNYSGQWLIDICAFRRRQCRGRDLRTRRSCPRVACTRLGRGQHNRKHRATTGW